MVEMSEIPSPLTSRTFSVDQIKLAFALAESAAQRDTRKELLPRG